MLKDEIGAVNNKQNKEIKLSKQYVAIDLKSFYASVECVERGLDPLKTNLVVADLSRTEKTVCLAVTPPLKAYGISGRARLFEVNTRVREINAGRRTQAKYRRFSGKSVNSDELSQNKNLALGFIIAPPRMALYLKYSRLINQIYLKYVAPEDVHIYSVDEVFIDVSGYIAARKITAAEFASMMVKDVYRTTGITATAGIGTNLYLCKVAMDILAKHSQPDSNGVRIAELDEMSYRRLLWNHRPLTDFWRVGRGYAAKLASVGLFTMGDIAKCSLGTAKDCLNEDLLYRMFGVNAGLLIDHAWGFESCTIADIKNYRPKSRSLSSGQVLKTPYIWQDARLVLKEMADSLSLDLVKRRLVCEKITVTIGYDRENLTRGDIAGIYYGEIALDYYGREVPKKAHGSRRLGIKTASCRLIVGAAVEIFEQITNPDLLIRRINIAAEGVCAEEEDFINEEKLQLDLFSPLEQQESEFVEKKSALRREKNLQRAVLKIKSRYGKNAVLKGMSFAPGATAAERNRQIGGHKA